MTTQQQQTTELVLHIANRLEAKALAALMLEFPTVDWSRCLDERHIEIEDVNAQARALAALSELLPKARVKIEGCEP